MTPRHSTPWHWLCWKCRTRIECVEGDAPVCPTGCTALLVPLSDVPEPRESNGPDLHGDAEDQVLYLVDRYGGRLVGLIADGRKFPTVAAWQAPAEGETRVPWQQAQTDAYAELHKLGLVTRYTAKTGPQA